MKPKKLLSFILAAAMTISLLPTFTLTASATATTEKNITLGKGALSGYDSTNGYDYVYYGTYENSPIKWRILSMNGNDGTYTDGDDNDVASSNAMFLLSEYGLKQMAYESAWNRDDGDGQNYPSDWRYSDAWNWCNDTTDSTSFISSSFTDSEKAYFLKTSKDNTSSPYTDELKGDTFFFLSYAEANTIYTESCDLVAKMSNTSGNAAWWWLRSPVDFDYVCCVYEVGFIDYDYVVNTYPAARPAFNLNLSSVLFTSAANGGKSSTAAYGGGAEIFENTDYTISGDEKYEYKLTMKDDSREEFTVTEKKASGDKGETLTFNYDKAETGTNEYISAMIVDDNGEVLYYGQLANITEESDESGTVNFKIPTDIDYGTYELRLFNEQINGDYKTDFSSNFETVTLNVKKTPTASDFTFTKPTDLIYDGKAKEATVTSSQNGMGDITVKYYQGTDEVQPINAGTYTVKIDVAEGTDYLSATDLTDAAWIFTVSPKDIADAKITLGDSLTYDGTEQTQTISKVEVDDLTLTADTDYTVSGNKGTEAKSDYKLTITGNGNFTGTATKQFSIAPLPVIIEWKNTDGLVYDGNPKTVKAEVSNKCGTDEVNLTFSENSDNLTQTAKGTYTATVTAVDNTNYTITGGQNLTKEWSIAQANDNEITGLSLDGWTYGNTASTPTATAKYGTPTFTYSTKEDGTYTDTVPTNAGTYWVKATVDGTEDYAEVSSEPISFEIAQATPTENPDKKTTARVKRGRTLAEAAVTEGEILGLNDTVIEGTFAWTDDTKTMSADGTEQMTFTPTDTNYAPITVDVAVSTYSSGGGGSSVTRYTVKFDTNGGTTITNQTVTKNGKATEPTKPTKEGYIFDGWYTDSEFTTEYDFTAKVTKNITLYAKWYEDEIQKPSDDKKDDEPQAEEWKNPFTDVMENDWFFDNIKYANQNGLMSGTTNSTFAPNDSLTRAMLVTVLWRAESEPNVDFAMPFTDVIDTAYYAEAVRWAASENIISGITETEFAPDENITREQIATIIYRYAKYKGYDVSVGEDTNILSYTDFDEISEYAISAMQYAVGSGLMKGKTKTTLNPKDNATRAEIAAILNRFIENNK